MRHLIQESFSSPYDVYLLENSSRHIIYRFKTEKNIYYTVQLTYHKILVYNMTLLGCEVIFYSGGTVRIPFTSSFLDFTSKSNVSLTRTGDTFRVFSTILFILNRHKERLDFIYFFSSKGKRSKFYRRLVEKQKYFNFFILQSHITDLFILLKKTFTNEEFINLFLTKFQ